MVAGVNTGQAIDYVIRTFNTFFNSFRNEEFARSCKTKLGIHTEDLVGMSKSSDNQVLFNLLKRIQNSISTIEQRPITSRYFQNNKALIQEYCKRD
jgi:hypothetical protein